LAGRSSLPSLRMYRSYDYEYRPSPTASYRTLSHTPSYQSLSPSYSTSYMVESPQSYVYQTMPSYSYTPGVYSYAPTAPRAMSGTTAAAEAKAAAAKRAAEQAAAQAKRAEEEAAAMLKAAEAEAEAAKVREAESKKLEAAAKEAREKAASSAKAAAEDSRAAMQAEAALAASRRPRTAASYTALPPGYHYATSPYYTPMTAAPSYSYYTSPYQPQPYHTSPYIAY